MNDNFYQASLLSSKHLNISHTKILTELTAGGHFNKTPTCSKCISGDAAFFQVFPISSAVRLILTIKYVHFLKSVELSIFVSESNSCREGDCYDLSGAISTCDLVYNSAQVI